MSKASSVIPETVALTGNEILQQVFGSFDEVQTALVATPDGFVVAEHGVPPEKDGAQMAAMASSMMAMARAVASEIGYQGSRRLTFETDDGMAIFQAVQSGFPCILCVVVKKGALLGRALWAVNEASSQMAARLHV